MMLKSFLSGIFILSIITATAQRMTPEEYVVKYKDAAIEEMHRSKVPASITLAQGLLETENGNSELVQKSNNHFGIKCKSSWQGESVKHTDDAPNECFRKYASARESYADHSDFLKANSRYASLFTLEPTDYKGWARGLKQAGYATNPRYPDILIGNIEKYELSKYDNAAVADVAIEDNDAIAPIIDNSGTATLPPAGTTTTDNNSSKFNGLKAIFAKANTSLLAIAAKANISLGKLIDFNDLKTDGLLQDDQYIYLERKAKEGSKETYTCSSLESLYDISQAQGVQLSALCSYNNLNANSVVKPGTVIHLKPAATKK